MVALGIQNDALPVADTLATGAAIHVQWLRIISVPGQPGIADKIRAAHDAGVKVILTVGGNGTSVRHPTVRATLRWIHKLPRADKYTWTNEPDLVGPAPCKYRRGWMRLRRVLGRALLWGDFSPHHPDEFTQRARACGPLVDPLPIAGHPYCLTDPLAACWLEGGIGNLGRSNRWLTRAIGVKVERWLTEFGYRHDGTNPISPEFEAWAWPRAVKRAEQVGAKVLVAYTAQGPSWDTSLGAGAIRALADRQPEGR